MNTAVVAGGVGACTLVLGTALAGLVSFYDFPGRRWLDWALVLPLAIPAYVLTFVYLGRLGPESELPLRSPAGAVAMLTLATLPVRLRAGQGSVPRPVAQPDRGGPQPRRPPVPGDRPGRVAAGAPGARRRRPAGDDGGARRLRLGPAPRRQDVHRRDLSGLVRGLRPARGVAAGQLPDADHAADPVRGARDARPPALRAVAMPGLRSSACACTVSRRGSRRAFPVLVLAIAFAGPLVQLLSWAFDSWDDPLVRTGSGPGRATASCWARSPP